MIQRRHRQLARIPVKNRLVRILARVSVAAAVIVALALTTLYVRSESLIRRSYDVASSSIIVPTGAGPDTDVHFGILGRLDLLQHPDYAYAEEIFRGAPNLSIVAAYSEADFQRLLRTGVALGERQLGLRSEVAQGRFAHFTHAEVRSLHGFLLARARDPSSVE